MNGHGPECPLSTPVPSGVDGRRNNGIVCDCVACHCGPLSDPSGFMASCARCYRPIVRDGRVVRDRGSVEFGPVMWLLVSVLGVLLVALLLSGAVDGLLGEGMAR